MTHSVLIKQVSLWMLRKPLANQIKFDTVLVVPHIATPLIFNIFGTLERNTTMTNFTSKQASYANKIILKLMKERRFFLFDERDVHPTFKDVDPMLDRDTFSEAWQLNDRHRTVYESAKMTAINEIELLEKELGITAAELTSSQSLVQCNRYTGGLDIHNAFPATSFMDFMPKSKELIKDDILTAEMSGKSVDEVSPNHLREINKYSTDLTDTLWKEYQELLEFNSEGEKVVVLLKTRFNPVYTKDGDLMRGKVDGMMHYSKILGYLAYKYSHHKRIVPHNHMITGTSESGHTLMWHWSDMDNPEWNVCNTHMGYSCKVFFLTVL